MGRTEPTALEGGRCHMASDSTSERVGRATFGGRPQFSRVGELNCRMAPKLSKETGHTTLERSGPTTSEGPAPEGGRRSRVTSGSTGEAFRKAEPTAFGRSPFAGEQRGAEKGTESATFGTEGLGHIRVKKGSLNLTNRARLLGDREKQGNTECSNLCLPQREKVRPTIWRTSNQR